MMRSLALTFALVLTASCQGETETASHVDLVNPNGQVIRAGAIRVPDDPRFLELEAFRPVVQHPGTCLTDEEIEAEAMIVLHNVLMVTGLQCDAYVSDPLFYRYTAFTATHQNSLRDAQTVLGQYLGRHKSGNRNRLFDTYRTRLANDESQLALRLSPKQYCQARIQQFSEVADFVAEEFRAFAREAADRRRNAYKTCDS